MKLITKRKTEKLEVIKNTHDFDKIMIKNTKIDKDKTISHLSNQIEQVFAILDL